MALQKTSLPLNFSKGLDTKTDKYQVNPGNFLLLQNSVFDVGGRLTKRNGFGSLTSLPSGALATSITTHNGNLVAFGNSLYAYNNGNNSWQSKGAVPPVSLSAIPVVRTAYTNSAPDVAVSSSGLACSVFLDGDGVYKYQITSLTGESIVGITALPSTATQARVIVFSTYFIITFFTSATLVSLQYIAIPLVNITNPLPVATIATSVNTTSSGYDIVVANNTLFTAWDANDSGGAIRVISINANLMASAPVVFAGHAASLISTVVDLTQNVIWVTAYDGTNAVSIVLNFQLHTVLPPTTTISAQTIAALTSTAQNGVLSIFMEVIDNYSYSSPPIRSDFVRLTTVTQAGAIAGSSVIVRSVGIGSKAFLMNGMSYLVVSYGGPVSQNSLEPTYFLIDSTGNLIARFAQANGNGYITTQVLPSATVTGNTVYIGYLYRDLIQAITRTDTSSQNGFYAQAGVNLMAFNLSQTAPNSVEIGGTLCITGGFLWMYDGIKPVEQGFHVYPENINLTYSTGGSLTAQSYLYQVTYEWTDGNGNIHRSSPSIPNGIVTTGSTSSITLNIPTLRLTSKVAPNAVRIVIYRWSTAQQTYYQVTSVTSPLINDPTVDYVTYVDTAADSSIVGNNILYTTGGVVENIPGPACDVIALFDDRVWLVSSEDRNSMWFSKQVIEATPVEMSDLFTVYVAPTTGAQGSTGVLTAISPMDDKLILFKPNALAYLNGTGPDNTGTNNQYSQPIFITSTIGSSNPKSIVFEPAGLIFDTNQGRWSLSRSLATNYIGAGVAAFNGQPALSAINVPGQNQVRLTLANTTLVYNYFYQQWGTFVGIPAISSTLYQGLHTFLKSDGSVFQETPGSYVDGSEPVLMAFQTSWFNLAGLQGFQRAYFFFLFGQYISPHKLSVGVAYEYNESDSQSLVITPTNYTTPYGSDAAYGETSPYGGPAANEWWRVYFEKPKCTAFRITLQEVFDPSFGTVPGAGFTLSGLNLIFGAKSSYPRLSAEHSAS